MPDQTPPPPPGRHGREPDDELVAAYVDGEVTDDERERVEADPALLARAEAFRSVAAAVGAPSDPAPPGERDRAVAAALEASQPGATVTHIGTSRRPGGVSRGWLAAAVLVLLALGAGVLATTGLDEGGGGDTDTAAAPTAEDGAETADESAGALAVGPSGAAVDLGEVADVDEVRARLAETTGIGADVATAEEAPESFGQGGDQPDAPVEGEGRNADEAGRLSQRCEIALVESNPQLLGQLVQATATYQGTEALVYAYSARSGPEVVVIIVAADDCRNLDRFVIPA